MIEHDIILVSAWAINAIPVAEMVLSQILLTCRGYFRAVRTYKAEKSKGRSFYPPGVNGETIGVDLLDDDGEVFAHLHFDPETAMSFISDLTNIVAEFVGLGEVKH